MSLSADLFRSLSLAEHVRLSHLEANPFLTCFTAPYFLVSELGFLLSGSVAKATRLASFFPIDVSLLNLYLYVY
jgi:hypothetical protein